LPPLLTSPGLHGVPLADVDAARHANPGAAVHGPHDVAPGSEKRPAGQSPEHAGDDSMDAMPKVPATHGLHATPPSL
jgi:hypothetical protein